MPACRSSSAEQQYIQRQKVFQALLPTVGNQIKAPDSAIAALQPDTGVNMRALASNPALAKAFSDEAIQRAILDRRNATTVVDPTIQRMNLGDYGFSNNDPYQKENDDLRAAVLGRNKAYEDAILNDANSELSAAQSAEQAEEQSKKGTPWWKKILGPAAAIGSAFIPGVGPLLSMAIGAGVGGASNGVGGAVSGGLAGYGAEALQAKSFNPFTGGGGNAARTIARPDFGMMQGNLAEGRRRIALQVRHPPPVG